MIRLYVIAAVASHATGTAYMPMTCLAHSVDEAVGAGIRLAKQTWPKHWNHSAVACVINEEHLTRGFAAIMLSGDENATPS